ncbi:hypothetical protein ADK90_23860 [Streptomyces sp. XY413]|uniref:hypothetical protein n=1 Tax=Streptomyces sp. XY413 TaxID=1519479 RepID=UPI0006ADD706|nr:hypothetical protein [Streptomyces sp. XY413]KOV17607.1 hypothetical protein ADK90_23860 [Streptomyces sp. XY413]
MYGDVWAWAASELGKAAFVALMVGLPAAGALAQQRQKDRAQAGVRAAPATQSRPGDALLLRSLSGRDLRPGEPSSSASWWRAGVEVERERTAAALAAEPGEFDKPAPPGTLRALLAGAGRWSCWPGVARTTVRLAVPILAVALWRGWWPVAAAVLAVLGVAAVAAAVTGLAVPGWWRPRPASAALVHGPGMWAALRPVLGVEEKERRNRWLHLPEDVTVPGARVVLRLPAGWVGGEAGTKAVDVIVGGRLPGEWTARWTRTVAAPYVDLLQVLVLPPPGLPYRPTPPTHRPLRVGEESAACSPS